MLRRTLKLSSVSAQGDCKSTRGYVWYRSTHSCYLSRYRVSTRQWVRLFGPAIVGKKPDLVEDILNLWWEQRCRLHFSPTPTCCGPLIFAVGCVSLSSCPLVKAYLQVQGLYNFFDPSNIAVDESIFEMKLFEKTLKRYYRVSVSIWWNILYWEAATLGNVVRSFIFRRQRERELKCYFFPYNYTAQYHLFKTVGLLKSPMILLVGLQLEIAGHN